jgi:hypothetical protein
METISNNRIILSYLITLKLVKMEYISEYKKWFEIMLININYKFSYH